MSKNEIPILTQVLQVPPSSSDAPAAAPTEEAPTSHSALPSAPASNATASNNPPPGLARGTEFAAPINGQVQRFEVNYPAPAAAPEPIRTLTAEPTGQRFTPSPAQSAESAAIDPESIRQAITDELTQMVCRSLEARLNDMLTQWTPRLVLQIEQRVMAELEREVQKKLKYFVADALAQHLENLHKDNR